METLRLFLMLGGLAFVFFVLPVALLVLFVNARAKARREMLAGPWSALAQQFGGRLEGERVLVARDAYQLMLCMELVSVMQAVGSPYYSDGGTYTEARLAIDPRADLRLVPTPVRLDAAQAARALPASPLAQLPPGARVVIGERDARVVFHGAVGDLRAIGSAFAGLEALVARVRAEGPLAVAA